MTAGGAIDAGEAGSVAGGAADGLGFGAFAGEGDGDGESSHLG